MTDPAVKAVPDHYGSVSPYVAVRGAAKMIDFMVEAFGGVERGRVPNPDGTLGHAEVQIGDSLVLLFDASPDWPPMPALLNLYVDDSDQTYEAAVRAGATAITPVQTSAWGDRGGRVRDPFGNIWWILSHVEDVEPDEMMRRMAEPAYVETMRVAVDSFDRAMREGPAPQP